jgi:ParB-like chromosome segregation protein Spo0J
MKNGKPAPTQKPKTGLQAKLTIQRVSIAKLVPHPDNPRLHPVPDTPAWESLKRSLKNDYFDPLVWNKRNGMLVSGHLRRKILEQLGYDSADVVVVNYDEKTHVQRMIAANRSVGDDDKAALAALLSDMNNDFDLTAMTTDEVDSLLASIRPPTGFPVVDENLPIEHKCPKCGYQWSGKPS